MTNVAILCIANIAGLSALIFAALKGSHKMSERVANGVGIGVGCIWAAALGLNDKSALYTIIFLCVGCVASLFFVRAIRPAE